MSRLVNKSNQDYYGGAMVFLIGLGAMECGESYGVGTLYKMGPGFLPIVVGAVMALMGLIILVSAKMAAAPVEQETPLPPEWRSWFLIPLSIVSFIVLGSYGGLVPASFSIVFLSALADRDNRLVDAVGLGLVVVALAAGIFWWALKMPFPLFRWG